MAITSTTLYSTPFDVVKNILRTSTVLNTKFNTNDYYEYFPAFSRGFRKYPFIVIRCPEVDDKWKTFRTNKEMNYNITITIYVEYLARNNLKTYLDALHSTLNSDTSQDTFQTNGMENMNINTTAFAEFPDIINNKKIVTVDINLGFDLFLDVS